MQSGYIINILITPLFSLIIYNLKEVQLLDFCAKCNFSFKKVWFPKEMKYMFPLSLFAKIVCLSVYHRNQLSNTPAHFKGDCTLKIQQVSWLSLMLRDKVSLGEQYCEFFATEKSIQ